jgi:hypothetical protein
VVAEADIWINKLRSIPTDQAGVQILELFVRDCLGQHSMEATIFTQKVQPLRNAYVMTWGIKCVAFSCLLIANLYFIFSCLLYGRNKGWEWQKGWLYTCLVNLLVDIFINSVTLASIIHYFVPNLILDKARSIRTSLTRIIHGLCEDGYKSSKNINTEDSQVRNAVFSSAAYFFVSAHVARAFPELLESKIVLANRTFLLSSEQLSKVAPQYILPTQSRQRESTGADNGGPGILSGWSGLLGLWITFAMLKFGSQSLSTQQAVISVLNPSIVSLIAMCGLSISKHSVESLGITGGVVVAVVLLLFGLHHAGKYNVHEFRLEEAHKRDEPVSLSLTQREIALFDTTRPVVDDIEKEPAPEQCPVDEQVNRNMQLQGVVATATANGRSVQRKVWFDANTLDGNPPAAPEGLRLSTVFRTASKNQALRMYDDRDGEGNTADDLLIRLRSLSLLPLEKLETVDDEDDEGDIDDEKEVNQDQSGEDSDPEFTIDEDTDANESEPDYMDRFQSMFVPVSSPVTVTRDHKDSDNNTGMMMAPTQSIANSHRTNDDDNDEEDGLDLAKMEQIIALAGLNDDIGDHGDNGSDNSSLDDYAELLEVGFIRDLTTVDSVAHTG